MLANSGKLFSRAFIGSGNQHWGVLDANIRAGRVPDYVTRFILNLAHVGVLAATEDARTRYCVRDDGYLQRLYSKSSRTKPAADVALLFLASDACPTDLDSWWETTGDRDG